MIPDVFRQLDLRSVRHRIAAERGWSETSLLRIEQDYIAFLAGAISVPKPLVEDFWHAHILDTQKYAADCQMLFGAMLHHIPAEGGKGRCRKALAA